MLASFEAAPRAVARAQSADLIEISDRGDILMVGEGSVPRRRLSTAILTRRTG